MNILMVSSEAVPFSKSGGLADVLGALSPALAKKGESVRVFMPMYSFIDRKGFRKSSEFLVPMLASEEKVYTLSKHLGGVEYAGLVPFYIREYGLRAKTVFTIHNLAYQGDFSNYDIVLTGDRLPDAFFSGNAAARRLNMLKGGIEESDKVTTVSPTYAEEIQTERFGCGLDWLLRERKEDLSGILNGMDTHEWNPKADKFFPEHYSSRDMAGKKALKARVQAENGLEVRDDIPLFAMISRIADQKGYAELLGGNHPVLEELLAQGDFQMLIVGTGDEHYEAKLRELASRYGNLSVRIAFSTKVAHETEGAADFFLMPSRYEPCGLNQMYSLHYGTLPVAHRTGGLADTIIDITSDPASGTGFLIENLSAESISDGVNRAIKYYNEEKEAMAKAIRRAMTTDLSWDKSASEYIELYNTLGKRRYQRRSTLSYEKKEESYCYSPWRRTRNKAVSAYDGQS